MAYVKTEDGLGRQVKVPVFNESEAGTGTWHVPVCDSSGYLKVSLQAVNDDVAFKLGTGGTVSILYETADADANALIFVAPEGGATDVPAFIFGDASILNADLTWFAGLTEPSIVVVNDAKDAYIKIDSGDDGVAGSKGIYFKAAADEDIEILNLSVTGTPRLFYDVSEDAWSSSIGLIIAGPKVLYMGNTAAIGTTNNDNDYFDFDARDNATSYVVVGRLVSAADPYWLFGRDDTGVSTSTVTDIIVIRSGAGANNEAAGQGAGIAIQLGNASSELEERASIDTKLVTATNGSEDASMVIRLMDGGTMSDVMTIAGADKSVNIGTSFNLKRFHSTITLDTGDAETAVGLTPSAVIMSAAIRVSTQITGLDSADHHIQLGVNGTASKYIDVAQGGAATTIDVNKKGKYTFDPSTDTEAAALVLTITGGADQIPTAGAVEVEVVYLDSTNLADV